MKKTGFFRALLRGGLKTMPGVSAIVELVKNVKTEIANNKLADGVKKTDIPHNYWSIAVQILGIAAIIYAFVSGSITIDDVLRLIGFDNGTTTAPIQ